MLTSQTFLDSGAPSLYNKLVRSKEIKNTGGKVHRMGSSLENRKKDDYSYLQTTEFKGYVESFIKFVHEHKDSLNVYANIDVINNPEETWKMQKYLESHGLNPIPVFHFGEDSKWLQMYVDNYEYIAIGGMVPLPFKILRPVLDTLWGSILTDSEGFAIRKIHGFAATSLKLMLRYPWYSVDSTSWIVFSMYGNILVPRKKNDNQSYDFMKNPFVVGVTSRRLSTDGPTSRHYKVLSSLEQKYVLEYLEFLNIPFSRVAEENTCRNEINCRYYVKLSEQLSKSGRRKFDKNSTGGGFFNW